jgi:N6-adenosine-specific RNA methylase IME4
MGADRHSTALNQKQEVRVEKYSIIYADPPWSYEGNATNQKNNRGGAAVHYNVMSLADICALPISDLAADNSLLFMWGAWPKLFEAKAVIDAWGFTFKTCAFVWVKTNRRVNVEQTSFLPVDSFDSFWGMGRWTRANTEFCLLAVKGKPKRMSAAVHQVIYAPIAKHSQKPAETRDRIIELAGDLPRVELFARKPAKGWEVWGNQVESTISLEAV